MIQFCTITFYWKENTRIYRLKNLHESKNNKEIIFANNR